MDDKRIEEMLRGSWAPQPPEGMKERIMRRARQELTRRKPAWPVFWPLRWKPALAAVALLLVIFTNASDHACQTRIAALMGSASSGRTLSPADVEMFIKQRREIETLLAQEPSEYRLPISLKGDVSL